MNPVIIYVVLFAIFAGLVMIASALQEIASEVKIIREQRRS